MKRALVMAVLCLSTAAPAATIILTNGQQLEGTIHKINEGWSVTDKDGKVVNVPADQVASIVAGSGANTPDEAKEQLESLRNSVKHQTDLNLIIARYEKFIAANTDQDVLDAATSDLQTWHQRLDQGMVKIGDDWVSSDEAARRKELAFNEAVAAAPLIQQGRYQEADAVIRHALSDDPQNASALYLQGVLYYQQDRIDSAQRSFQAANDVDSSNAATLNNLGVIAWRTRSPVVAISLYNKAMLAAPETRQVLDNVAEALNAMPEQSRHAPVVHQATLLFQQQDSALQRVASQSGWFRWGATWVTAAQMNQLKAVQEQTSAKLDELAQQVDDLQDQINKVQAEIDENTREMHRLQASVTQIDQYGNTTQFGLPQLYFDLQRDNEKLTSNRDDLTNKQTAVRATMTRTNQPLPIAQFSGVQHTMGVEGAWPPKGQINELPTTFPSPPPASTQP